MIYNQEEEEAEDKDHKVCNIPFVYAVSTQMRYSEDSPGCGPHGGQETCVSHHCSALVGISQGDRSERRLGIWWNTESRQGWLWGLILGHWEVGKLLWEMWNVREPGFRGQCRYEVWWPPTSSVEQWQNTGARRSCRAHVLVPAPPYLLG